MFRTCSAVCARLAFAGTLRIQAIPLRGQPSFEIAPYSSPMATRFMTCSVVSICGDDRIEDVHAFSFETGSVFICAGSFARIDEIANAICDAQF